LAKLDPESFKALIIPSFCYGYNKVIMNRAYDLPIIRSAIKEFHMQEKIIVALGPTSVNLVAKCLDYKFTKLHTQLKINHKEPFKFKYYEEDRVLYLPYRIK
jgi:hypothetical protein